MLRHQALGRCPKPRKGHCPLTRFGLGLCLPQWHRKARSVWLWAFLSKNLCNVPPPLASLPCGLFARFVNMLRHQALGRCPKARKGHSPLTRFGLGLCLPQWHRKARSVWLWAFLSKHLCNVPPPLASSPCGLFARFVNMLRHQALGRCPKPRKGHCPLTLYRCGGGFFTAESECGGGGSAAPA